MFGQRVRSAQQCPWPRRLDRSRSNALNLPRTKPSTDLKCGYAMEEPTSLNTLELLPALMEMGIAAIKIEGRQRSPAYVGQVTQVWRSAIDRCARDPAAYKTHPEWRRTIWPRSICWPRGSRVRLHRQTRIQQRQPARQLGRVVDEDIAAAAE
jgi:collagenase-like PrtC family protease